jgi:hypothetical protein
MAAPNYTPISLYYSASAGAQPLAANLVNGELAINITDGKLYYKNNLGVVTLFAPGSIISNDTSTTSNLYPLFAAATSGAAATIYTGNANLLYKPSTGELTSRAPIAGNGIFVNNQTVATSYTIAAGYSGVSSGPVTVASGATVTVSSGSRWAVV